MEFNKCYNNIHFKVIGKIIYHFSRSSVWLFIERNNTFIYYIYLYLVEYTFQWTDTIHFKLKKTSCLNKNSCLYFEEFGSISRSILRGKNKCIWKLTENNKLLWLFLYKKIRFFWFKIDMRGLQANVSNKQY